MPQSGSNRKGERERESLMSKADAFGFRNGQINLSQNKKIKFSKFQHYT
jgi:hypothetical protein